MLVRISYKNVGKVESPKFPNHGEWVLPKDVPEKVLIETELVFTEKMYPPKDEQPHPNVGKTIPGIKIGTKLFLFGVPSPDGVVDTSSSTMKVRIVASGTTVVLTQE